MNRFVHIGFRFEREPNYQALEQVISNVGDDWIRYSADNWILWSSMSVMNIYRSLTPYLSQADHVLIAGLIPDDLVGYLPPWMWTWMHSKNPASGVVFGDEMRQAVLTQLRPPE